MKWFILSGKHDENHRGTCGKEAKPWFFWHLKNKDRHSLLWDIRCNFASRTLEDYRVSVCTYVYAYGHTPSLNLSLMSQPTCYNYRSV